MRGPTPRRCVATGVLCVLLTLCLGGCRRHRVTRQRVDHDVTLYLRSYCSQLRADIFTRKGGDMESTVKNYEAEINRVGNMGTPFSFRAVSADEVDMYSSGYDQVLGTRDDLFLYCDVSER